MVGEAQVGDHRAAALRHAVHLGLLHLQALGGGRAADHRGHAEHALTADAGEDDVVLHAVTSASRRLRFAVCTHSLTAITTDRPGCWISSRSRAAFCFMSFGVASTRW